MSQTLSHIHSVDHSSPTEREPLPDHLTRSRGTLEWVHKTSATPHPRKAVVSRRADPAPLLQRGELLEHKYEVRGRLGSGGMGQVYEAHDRQLKRTVAIKIAWPHIEADALRKEAQVLAAFHHPGLALAYALGQHRGQDFLVMERIAGSSLSDHLRRQHALSVDETLDVLSPICKTLSLLHANGLAHADLKPSNIMLAPSGRVVLLDFGIARIEQAHEKQKVISGSPHYMAPEAIRGRVRPGEAHLVDIYALGVIAYVMLTGEAPYDHRDAVELMIQHLERAIPDVRKRCPDAPPRLAQLISAMLAKRPEDRPPRIEVVHDDLHALRSRKRCAPATR